MPKLNLSSIIFLSNAIILTSAVLTILKYDMCNNSNADDAPFKIYSKFRISPSKETFMDSNATFKRYFGDQSVKFTISSSIDGNIFIPIVTIKDKNFCTFLKNYLGDIWFDMMVAAGDTSRSCPVRPGFYKVENYKVNINKLKLTGLPSYGSIKQLLYDKDRKEISCVDIEFRDI